MQTQPYYAHLLETNPPLPADEQRELCRRWQQHQDLDARNTLITSNLQFAVSYARNWMVKGVYDMGEVITLAAIGLARAADSYNPDGPYRFISYAVNWIRQQFLLNKYENKHTQAFPEHMREIRAQVANLSSRLEQQHGHVVREELVTDQLGLIPETVQSMHACRAPLYSLDAYTGVDENIPLYEVLPSDDPWPDANAEQSEIADTIRTLVDETLHGTEYTIIIRRFCLDGLPPETLEEIGVRMNYSKERVRQIERAALDRLRARAHTKNISLTALTA